jgi:hypothetical protein
MNERKTAGTAVVTESAAQGALRRGSPARLAADEERALRMRLGASLPRAATLDRLAVASDAEIEVLAYELEAFLKLRAGRGSAPRTATVAVPTASRAKEKIVRALRKKA